MYFILSFLILILFMNIVIPLTFRFPLLGLVFWIGIPIYILHTNKKRREAFFNSQQQYSGDSYSNTSSPRPDIDPKDIIDAEYTEHEIK